MAGNPAEKPSEAPDNAAAQTGKLSYLNSVERHRPAIANVDRTRPKYFITFPYPYMNGKLHLGHLYTFSKADFTAYYRRLQGYNVLLPFAFHCTGMPISASASKLREELAGRAVDVSVVGILNSLGFEDVAPFTDPLHWIKTFPGYGRDTLTAYHASIDWRRSFITTSMNRYYDSFVRFQFNRLRRAGLLSFGKRYSIFCTIDQQPCLDHDRRRGEGIKPVEVVLRKIGTSAGTLLVPCDGPAPLEKVVLCRSTALRRVRVGARVFVAEERLCENMKYQVDGVELLDEVVGGSIKSDECAVENTDNLILPKAVLKKVDEKAASENKAAGADLEFGEILGRKNERLALVESTHFVKIYVPDGLVISRSGSHCVVSLLDQWFIDYGDEEWKRSVKECVDAMDLTADTRMKLEESLAWINRWAFSRSFGLGTRVPWDEQYLIDSLSDSTIYMAFYTFKHLLFDGLAGEEEHFPAELLCDEFWGYIFANVLRDGGDAIPERLLPYKTLMDECRASLEYFYPVDLRVSGKDLIGNHLLFFLFNHVGLFKKEFWPQKIFTNGHIMLNSAKMSKSDGNFLSVEDALRKFGASATRMCLASCGDTNEDANFEESNSNAFVLRLYTLVKAVEDLRVPEDMDAVLGALFVDEAESVAERLAKYKISGIEKSANISDKDLFIDQAFVQMLASNARLAIAAYDALVFRDVVKYAFFENLHLIEQYSLHGGCNAAVTAYAYRTLVQLIYPITPSLSTYLLELKFGGDVSMPVFYASTTDKVEALAHMRSICSKIMAGKRGRGSVQVCVSREYLPWKIKCMGAIDAIKKAAEGRDEKAVKGEVIEQTRPILATAGVPPKKGLVFCMDYLKNPASYFPAFDEFAVLSLFRNYMEGAASVKVEVCLDGQGEPLAPMLRFSE